MKKKQKLLKIIAFAVCVLILGVKSIIAQPNNADKPNILYIMTDQQRFDALRFVQDELADYNGRLKVKTPNLNRLASEGAYFRNAYTHCAVCGPARTTLRTGLTLEGHGSQSNSLVYNKTYTMSPNLFLEKIENAVSLDHVMVEERGYVDEYYGKWHMPNVFAYSRSDNKPIITYNHYDFETGQFVFSEPGSWSSLYKEYLDYYNNQNEISKNFVKGTQANTFSKYPYIPVGYDARVGYPTNTPLTNPPFASTSQPNVMGKDMLAEKYTPTGLNGYIGLQALKRLVQQNKPFFLTLSFHNPHAPMVATPRYFDYYFENRKDMFLPPSLVDMSENTGYKYGSWRDPERVREWMACYYALVEEIDHWIGQLYETLDANPEVRDNTIIVFTSDHGEMLGAHGNNEKNKFLEESARIPLLIKAPGQIEAGTVVEETVNLLDLYSTILDYTNASSYDNSQGTSLRRFIERTNYNKEFDEEHIVTEWDYRSPNGTSLDRALGGEINFHSKKGPFKLMMTKKTTSGKIDMMYNVDNDPYEMDNLIGNKGMLASEYNIGKAEYLKALLIDWMIRMDGSDKLYSDPKWNNGEGKGDIAEIRNRRTWKALDFWVCDTTVYFGNAVDVGGTLIRNEWIYLGRATDGTTTVSSISLEGADAGLFALSGFASGSITKNEYKRIKVQYTPASADSKIMDAQLRIKHNTGADIVIKLTNKQVADKIDGLIDDCDMLPSWESEASIKLDVDNSRKGAGCIEVEGNAFLDFKKVFSQTVNTGLSATETKLEFWYYVSDVNLLGSENQVEIGSGGASNSNLYAWSIDKTELHNGWNHISLNINNATITGTPDLSAINWFSLSRSKTGVIVSRIDDIRLVTGDLPLPGTPSLIGPSNSAQGIKVPSSMDWIAGRNAYEHEIYLGTTNPPPYLTTQADNSFRLTELEENTTYYWQIKEKNPSGVTAGPVWSFKSISAPAANSAGVPANNSEEVSTSVTLSWTAGALSDSHNVYFGTTNPPSFIQNQPGTAYIPEGPLELETTYYWMVESVNEAGTAPGTIYSFTTRANNSSGITVLDDCDSKQGWGGANLKDVNSTDQKQGIGCLYSSGDNTNDFQKVFVPAYNTGVAEADAQLEFWYYVADVSQLKATGQIEIGSAGRPDVDEYNWSIDISLLQNGWNLIQLDFSAAIKKGSPNLAAINWFRLYRHKNGVVETRIDYITIKDKSITQQAPSKAKNPVPELNATDIELSTSLSWLAGTGAESHDVYFGITNPPNFVGNQSETTYTPGELEFETIYYWRIDEKNGIGTADGEVWSFATKENDTSIRKTKAKIGYRLQPNPSNGIVNIVRDVANEPVLVQVLDVQGRRKMKVESSHRIINLDLSHFAKGPYYIVVIGNEAIETQKVLLN